MTEKDEIKELFSKSFEGFEKEVDPGLWDKIQSNLSQSPDLNLNQSQNTLTKAGWVKTVVVGVVSVSSIVAGIIYLNKEDKNQDVKSDQIVNDNQELIQDDNLNTNKEDLVVIQEDVNSIKMIDTSEDPVIIEHKEEIRKEILEDLKESHAINYTDIDNLLDQDLLNELNKQETAKSEANVKSDNQVEKNNDQVEENIQNPKVESNQNSQVDFVEKEKSDEEKYLEKLPNVITPNGDHINDFVELKHKDITNFDLLVFNESGKLIFERSGDIVKWSGEDNTGRSLKEGTYRIMIVANSEEGSRYVRKSLFYIRK